MIDHVALLVALRARLVTLSVCSTGSVPISAVAGGYARSTGSFLTDGLAAGQEISAAGFGLAANNGLSVITDITASTLRVTKTPAAIAEAEGLRTLFVGLPNCRIYENKQPAARPVPGIPYIEEDYLPGPVELRTVGPGGVLEGLPQYVIRVYGVSNVGHTAIARYADAILTLFAPKTAFLVGADQLRVRGDVAPFRGQLLPDAAGWVVSAVNIPLRCFSTNVN